MKITLFKAERCCEEARASLVSNGVVVAEP
jgi:hypothetical protein